jgi:uncharacterized protein (TIGR03435 family)
MMKRLFYVVALTTVAITGGFAQVATEKPASGQPGFEVASVKPAPPDVEIASMYGGPMPAGPFNQSGRDPGRVTWSNVRLLRMIQVAYDFPLDRINGPDWLGTQGYDVVATVPVGASVDDFRKMVQTLLAERFKLTVHRGTKEVSGYTLEIGKTGAKIAQSATVPKKQIAADDRKPNPKRAEALQYMATRTEAFKALVGIDENGFPAPRAGNPYYSAGAGFEATIVVYGRYRAVALNHAMSGIADFLGNILGSPVQDHTGLAGKYDLRMEYLPRGSDATDPGPDVLDAVQEQLGLKLTPRKVPVETLIIDHAEKIPTEN